MKKFTIGSLMMAGVCWAIAAVLLVIFGEKGFEKVSQEVIGRKVIEFQTKKEDLEPGQVKNLEEIEILFPHASVEIYPSKDEGLHVEYPGSEKPALKGRIEGKRIKYDFESYFEGTENKIVVRLFNGNGFIHLGDTNASRIAFRIPKNFKVVKAKSNSGDLKIDSLNLATLRFDTTSGEFRAKRANLSKLNGTSTSGDLRFQGYVQNAELKTVSGDIKVESENKSPTVVAGTTSGNITVDFEEPPSVKLAYETVSGEVSVDSGSDEKVEEVKRKDKIKLGAAEGDVKVKTVSGDIRVRQTELF